MMIKNETVCTRLGDMLYWSMSKGENFRNHLIKRVVENERKRTGDVLQPENS